LPTSEGIKKLKGTRNAPTVVNAAYYDSQFWDGRRPSLEEQSKDPLINPIEHGLPSHAPVLETIRSDESYASQFKSVFGVTPQQITIDHVAKAIASFERTLISGDSAFDRYL
jgi:cytochrome c peroxidase